MQPDATKLSPKQQRAIEALLTNPGVDAAARTAGINSSTLWRWLQQPAFDQAYRDARSRLLEEAITALRSASLRAVRVLVEVMDNSNAADQTRVSAAKGILELTMRSREFELEERIRTLELAMGVRHEFRPPGKWPRDDAG